MKKCEACIIENYTNNNKIINIATQKHHKFPKTKYNLKLYGVLIHNKKNIMDTCGECNVGHKGLGLIIWDEIDFCKVMQIEPKSKSYQIRKNRERNYSS